MSVSPDIAPETPPVAPPIDWQQEARAAAARMTESLEAEGRCKREFTSDPRFARAAPRPQFGWDRSKTHRVKLLWAGGTLVHLNDRCVLVLHGHPDADLQNRQNSGARRSVRAHERRARER